MRKIRVLVLIVVILAVGLPGTTWAAPASPSLFTISPNPAFPGETVTFRFNIDGLDFGNGGPFTLCFYSGLSSGQTYTFPASFVSQQLDTWTLQAGQGNCVTATNLRARYTTSTTNGDFGDTLTFNVAVGGTAPVATVNDSWQIRQYDSTTETTPRAAASVQWIVASTIYVANDTGTCGSNTPCLTGGSALNRAIDGVSDPGGVGTPGVITVLGAYNLNGGETADLTTAKEVLVNGGTGASISNSGACSNATVLNAGGALSVDSLVLNGTCLSGQRTAGLSNSSGTLNIKNVTLQNFTGSGTAVQAAGGIAVVEGSTFTGNNVALDSNGGTLYAFANNVTTNIGANVATNIDSGDNVKCNYWSSYNISGSDSAAQFEKRLGSPVSTYLEGAGALTLGRASLAVGAGSRVLVDLGRSISAPPFGNGTVSGLGALTSDFFAACLARNGSTRGDLTVTADNVTPGINGHRLYHVTQTADCSPSTNTACWDYAGQSSVSAGAALTDTLGNEGHYVIGNQVDPTAITLRDLSATAQVETGGLWVGIALTFGLLVIAGWSLRRRAAQS